MGKEKEGHVTAYRCSIRLGKRAENVIRSLGEAAINSLNTFILYHEKGCLQTKSLSMKNRINVSSHIFTSYS